MYIIWFDTIKQNAHVCTCIDKNVSANTYAGYLYVTGFFCNKSFHFSYILIS